MRPSRAVLRTGGPIRFYPSCEKCPPQDEIESLEKEVEELKGKNLSLESQLKIALDPQSLNTPNENEAKENPDPEKGAVDPKALEDWTKKLKASNVITVKIRDDMEKLKEVNKKLRTENCGFVRENLRLKAEVDSRSPQKFGRFTVAALQSKVDQHERETNRLKKALERSDEYIDELESQVTQLKRVVEDHQKCMKRDGVSAKANGCSEDSTSLKSQETTQSILTPSQSSDNLEQPSLSGLQDDSMMCLSSSSQDSLNGLETHCGMNKEMFSGSQEDLLDTATAVMTAPLEESWENKIGGYMASKGEDVCMFPILDTPTMSLSSLQLNTPNNKESPSKEGKKSSSYLRKLTFDFPCETTGEDNSDSTENNESSSLRETLAHASKNSPMFWNYGQADYNPALEFDSSDHNIKLPQPLKSSSIANDKACQFLFKRLQAISDAEINRARTSSEASMDAAYLDKISELDSMMSESESSKSPYRFRPADFASMSKISRNAKPRGTEKTREHKKVNPDKCSESSNEPSNSEEWKPITFSVLSPSSLQMNEHFPLFSDDHPETEETDPQKDSFVKDQHSPKFLFGETRKLATDLKSESSFFNVCAQEDDHLLPGESPWVAPFVPEERSRSNSHSTKRKIQSSLSSASPSKSSKNSSHSLTLENTSLL
ncbi:ORC ubiquitin ligase 1 isoform X2 [Ambystoma mexicanum]|uniref:ORC ubiquitin ligase 1 isoform X2 n=1 Tax=Ambystoma mexicanum TaxID=8296 RepID=UPI0037E81AC9